MGLEIEDLTTNMVKHSCMLDVSNLQFTIIKVENKKENN